MEYDRIKPWENIVTGVSREYSRKFTMVDAGDIKQNLYEWFLAHPNKLDTWESLGMRDAKNLLYRSLRNQALDYCQYWKAKGGGYELDDVNYYTVAMIESLMPVVLGVSATKSNAPSQNKTSRPSVQAESFDLEAMVADVSVAYERLSDMEKEILALRFADDLDYPGIADLLSMVSDDAARAQVKKVIKKVINTLGGFRPHLDTDDLVLNIEKSEGE